jgi:DNA-binding Lrp family transcriptional regulator
MPRKTVIQGIPPAAFALTRTEADVGRRLQGDIPVAERPFASIASDLGLTEAEVLSMAGSLQSRGVIRKFGAIVRHQLAGYLHNVMVVWAVPDAQCDAAGRRLAAFREITHCYRRSPAFERKYTLFTMVHFQRETDAALLRKMAAVAGVSDFKVLRSIEEFKKTSMEYF